MDASGTFLSPKANAFSIAHLIDASQCIQDGACMRMNDFFNWSSQVLTKEMEGQENVYKFNNIFDEILT